MNIFIELLNNFLNLANAMSIYILFGLLIAGFLKELLPKDFIIKHLGKNNLSSVIKATILGIPMPVCSCSVIPLAKSLNKEGASPGASQSFLISTPITGVDSMLATYSLFGWIFTLYRVVSSIIIAIVAGVLQNMLYKPDSKISLTKPKPINLKKGFVSNSISFSNSSCNSSCCSNNNDNSNKKSFNLKRVMKYAFETLFSDISKSLFYGLVIGALFSTFLPKEMLASSTENIIFTYILILIISMPLYVCATSSLPIGASLLASGLPIGAVFLFLTAGPATNSVTMSVVKDMFGKRGLMVYIFTITILSIFFAYFIDIFIDSIEITKYIHHTQNYSLLNYISTAIMLILILYYWRKK